MGGGTLFTTAKDYAVQRTDAHLTNDFACEEIDGGGELSEMGKSIKLKTSRLQDFKLFKIFKIFKSGLGQTP